MGVEIKKDKKKDVNPLDEGLAKVFLKLASPMTWEEQLRLGLVHKEFTVLSSILIGMETFHEEIVPPLKATGLPLYKRMRPLTDIMSLIYKSSGSGGAELVKGILEHVSPSLQRVPPIPAYGGIPEPTAFPGSPHMKGKKAE